MIPQYEMEFGAYLLKRIKHDKVVAPEGFDLVSDVPRRDANRR